MGAKKLRNSKYLSILLLMCLLLVSVMAGCTKKDTKEQTTMEDTTEAVVEPEATPTVAPTQAPTATPVEEDLVTRAIKEQGWPEDFSLREVYQEDFLLGTIYTDASRNGQDKELTLKHFNVITPENIMKPEYMQPTEGFFDYTNSDIMLKFAGENKLSVHGHTLAWHQQTGDWLGKNVSRDEAIKQLKSHITNIVGKYKGQIMSWDVVNEAIKDGVTLPSDGDWTKCLRETQWTTSIGSDYLAMAFTFAHQADPDTKLYYNDYNLNQKAKADIVYAMVKDLKAQGIPIDGIGMQGHYNMTTAPETVEYSLKLFSELKVEISITELDISVDNVPDTGLTEDQEIKQAVTYAKLFRLFKQYKDSIARVTFWGYLDKNSWRADKYPLLFKDDYSPKLAAYAVYDPDKFLSAYAPESTVPVVFNTAEANYGTPAIDGKIDEIWESSTKYDIKTEVLAWEGATGTVRVLWDDKFVYALIEVKDPVLNKQSENAYEQDSIELYLDQKNEKAPAYDDNDGQYRVNYVNDVTFGTVPTTPGFTSAAKEVEGGYLVEAAIPLMEVPTEGTIMGFDAQINDSDENGMRQSITKFNDNTDNSYQITSNWGNVKLVK